VQLHTSMHVHLLAGWIARHRLRPGQDGADSTLLETRGAQPSAGAFVSDRRLYYALLRCPKRSETNGPLVAHPAVSSPIVERTAGWRTVNTAPMVYRARPPF